MKKQKYDPNRWYSRHSAAMEKHAEAQARTAYFIRLVAEYEKRDVSDQQWADLEQRYQERCASLYLEMGYAQNTPNIPAGMVTGTTHNGKAVHLFSHPNRRRFHFSRTSSICGTTEAVSSNHLHLNYERHGGHFVDKPVTCKRCLAKLAQMK